MKNTVHFTLALLACFMMLRIVGFAQDFQKQDEESHDEAVQSVEIDSINLALGKEREDTSYQPDPNYSRLMYAPTGRPLRKGEGYFSDVYVFFPGIAYGVTDNVSVLVGISIIPDVGMGDQLRYIAPNVGFSVSEEFAISVGTLYTSFGGDFTLGIAYGVGSLGKPGKSITFGIGFGYSKFDEEDLEFSARPILMLGGNIRTSKHSALILETWIITDENVDFGEQPKAFAIRFMGERLSADVGFILFEALAEGFAIPWLSFAYNFGG